MVTLPRREENVITLLLCQFALISRDLFICVRLRSSSIHRIWLRFPWLCAIFPTYTSFLGSPFCVWHSGAKQPFSFSLSKVPGLSFTLNQTLCLCLAWFTHSLLRSPQKRKKTLESHQGAMKIDATKKEASWKLCLTTELLLFFNYTELWWAGSSKNSLLNLKRGNTKIQDSAENGFWDRVRGVFLSFTSRLLFRIVPRQPKNKAASTFHDPSYLSQSEEFKKIVHLYFSALSRMFFLSVPASRPLGRTFLPVTVFLSHRLISHSCIVGKTIKCLHMVPRPAQLCREAHAGNSERTGRRDATIQTYGEIKQRCGFVMFNMTNKNHEHMHER